MKPIHANLAAALLAMPGTLLAQQQIQSTDCPQSPGAASPGTVIRSEAVTASDADPATAQNARKQASDQQAKSDVMSQASDDMAAVLGKLKELGPKPITELSAEQARQQPSPADAVAALIEDKGLDVSEPKVSAKDTTYPAAEGQQPARIYTPDNAGERPLPLVVYVHGGGWVLATIDTYDATPRALAEKLGAVVVSLEYRHAPEHKFPASHEDVLAGYKWAVENAADWNADPQRLALVGESVGGNMVVATAIAARDNDLTQPDAVVSVYPVTQTSLDTESYQQNADAVPLNKPMMKWFFEKATADKSQWSDPRISLVDADLSDLPPTLVINAQIDPLLSDGQMLAKKLKAAGVDAKQSTYDGVTHEFFGMAAVVDAAKQAQSEAVDFLKSNLPAAE